MATTHVKVTSVQGILYYDSIGGVKKKVNVNLSDQSRELSVGIEAAELLAVENRTFYMNVGSEPKHVSLETQAREVLVEHEE